MSIIAVIVLGGLLCSIALLAVVSNVKSSGGKSEKTDVASDEEKEKEE